MSKFNPFDPANGYSEEDRVALETKCASLMGMGMATGRRSQILRSAIMALLALALERLLEHLHRAEMLSQARP